MLGNLSACRGAIRAGRAGPRGAAAERPAFGSRHAMFAHRICLKSESQDVLA